MLTENKKRCIRCGRILKQLFYSNGHGPFGSICQLKYQKEHEEQNIIDYEPQNYYQERWEEFKKQYGLVEIENNCNFEIKNGEKNEFIKTNSIL
jgi:hypothetical protein